MDDVYACDGTTTGATTFDNPGTGVYAWQCTELSARFLWAIYGIWAGPGSGVTDGADLVSEVHASYPSISVGTPGPGSVPAVGDVISLGPGGGFDPKNGHTAVVISANAGTGNFKIMSENDPDGTVGEQSLQVDLTGHHDGYVKYGTNWALASWLEVRGSGWGTWGKAVEVPGTSALNAGGYATVSSISCRSAGNCSGGGEYYDGSGNQQALVVNETNGTWGNATEVPNTAALNAGGNAGTESVSCASAGNCSAGGLYFDSSESWQAFVVNEANGTWGNAAEAPGTAALNVGSSALASVDSVSCASAGNCGAGGGYTSKSGGQQTFVISETNGTWGKAIEVPNMSALNVGGNAGINSVSCASAGNCSAGGYYTDASDSAEQAFLVNETNGTWGKAAEVPNTSALNQGGTAEIETVSCASPGNCSAGGLYSDGSQHLQAFVVNEANGTWGNAAEVSGTGGFGVISSMSCASAGNCSAGGQDLDGSGNTQVFVVSETSGTWGSAAEVPNIATLNAGKLADITSMSCASAGKCSAGGWYVDGSGHTQAFVFSETNGTWGNAAEVPNTPALNAGGNAEINSVSCGSAGNCSAGGYYTDGSGNTQAFVVNETDSN